MFCYFKSQRKITKERGLFDISREELSCGKQNSTCMMMTVDRGLEFCPFQFVFVFEFVFVFVFEFVFVFVFVGSKTAHDDVDRGLALCPFQFVFVFEFPFVFVFKFVVAFCPFQFVFEFPFVYCVCICILRWHSASATQH